MFFSICIFRPSPWYTISSISYQNISNRIFLCRLVASCCILCPDVSRCVQCAFNSSAVFPRAKASGCAKKLDINSSWLDTGSPSRPHKQHMDNVKNVDTTIPTIPTIDGPFPELQNIVACAKDSKGMLTNIAGLHHTALHALPSCWWDSENFWSQ